MFTPQEVSEKTFPKSSSFSSGYDLAAVDEFLDTLTEDYTALYKENAALKAKLKILAEKLEEYRATEDTMRSMLLAAQKMAASMTDEAKEKSEKMLAEARSQREQILEEAQNADRVIVMNDGKIIADDKPKVIFSDVESLKRVGLDVPQTAELLYNLKKNGFNVDTHAISIKEAAEQIFAALHSEGK